MIPKQMRVHGVVTERVLSEPGIVTLMQPKANLDFMRAVAVIFVVIDHTCLALHVQQAGPWNPGWLGVLGIFMFFVHTTLVLMWSLERRPHALDFYVRRIFRIYPLALLAIAIASIAHAPVTGSPAQYFGRIAHSPMDILVHCLLIQNLRPKTPPFVNVMWTLPLEMQMYVVLPVLFAYARQIRRVWPLLLLWLLSVAVCRSLYPDPNTINLVTVVPMFLPGVVAYVLFVRRRAVLPAWVMPLLLAGLTVYFMRAPANRKGWYVALALGLSLPLIRELRARWVVRCSHFVAQYSYGIYLSHPFALVLGMYLLRNRPLWLQLTVELGTIVVASTASYHWLELPMIRTGARLAARFELSYEEVTRADEVSPRSRAPVAITVQEAHSRG